MKAMLFSVLIIAAALRSAAARGFLDCHIRRQLIDGHEVSDVLRTFYNDVVELRAIEELEPVSAASEKYTDRDRAEGLKVLRQVTQFNWQVDVLFGIKRSPNLPVLAAVSRMLGDQVINLRSLGSMSSVVEAQRSEHPSGGAEQRVGPTVSDFNGPTAAKRALDETMYEFAQKLQILLAEPGRAECSQTDSTPGCSFGKIFRRDRRPQVPRQYVAVVEHSRFLDPKFAKELEKVVQLIGTDAARAVDSIEAMCTGEGDETKKTFLLWFRVELTRLSAGRCERDSLARMDQDIDLIRALRVSRDGVSVGEIGRLQAKVAFLKVLCFQQTLEEAAMQRLL